jgi:predicted transcriptional regulator
MGKKRTRLEVMHDILEVIKNRNGKIKPTHILYKSNLSYQMMEEYLDELIKKGFILEKKTERSRTYILTEKGFTFLSKYGVIKEFTDSFGLE